MHHAVAHKLRVLQAGNQAEHPLLLAEFQVGLEAHQIVHGVLAVLTAQLHIGPGPVAGAGVGQAHRPQGAEAHGVRPAAGHHLNGHTALVHRQVAVGIKVVQGCPLGGGECLVKGLVLRLVEGAVQVVGLAPAVAAGGEHLFHVQAFGGDDGGGRVIERQALPADEPLNVRRQRAVGQGAGGHQHRGALVDLLHPLAVQGDVGVVLHQLGHFLRKGVPVHRQRTAGGHPGLFRTAQKAGTHQPHLFLQQAGGRIQPLRLQAVGADQLRKAFFLVGRAEVQGLLLIQMHLYPLICQPQGGLAPGQACPQDLDLTHWSALSHTVFQNRSLLWRSTVCRPCGTALRRTCRRWSAPARPRS